MILTTLPSTAVYVPGRRGSHTNGNGVYMDDNNSRVIQDLVGGKTTGHPCQDCFECDATLNVGSLPETRPVP